MASAPMQRAAAMPASALRVLDSRILTTALGFLDTDAGALLVEGLTQVQALIKASRDTRAAPGESAVTNLIRPHTMTSTQRPHVALLVDDHEIARVDFELNVKFEIGKTSVAVRYGAIESIDCEACSLTVTLSLVGTHPSLLQRTAKLPVQWDLHPPVVIALPEDHPAPTRPQRARQTVQ